MIAKPSKGKLTNNVVGCTGYGPYDEQVIREHIEREMGIVGDKNIWQIDQIVVVGRIGCDYAYLKKSLEIGNRYYSTFRYMSQEDFLDNFLQGQAVVYQFKDPRILLHEGLLLLKQLGWQPIPIHKVPWSILPPGEYPFDRILRHFAELAGESNLKIDEGRLRLIYSLNPTAIYIGTTDEFRRYVIFYFEAEQKAILECPVFGNAIYVIDGDWKELSMLTKEELLRYYQNHVRRVIHKGNWFDRLTYTLFCD